MGDVIGDLNSRRGMVNKFEDKPGGMKLVQAYVPLAEMFNYVSTLRGMTKGRANYRCGLVCVDFGSSCWQAGTVLWAVAAVMICRSHELVLGLDSSAVADLSLQLAQHNGLLLMIIEGVCIVHAVE
jgi:hypothetical protein